MHKIKSPPVCRVLGSVHSVDNLTPDTLFEAGCFSYRDNTYPKPHFAMAELLGLAASIVAVLQLAGQLTIWSYSYIGGVKEAPSTIQQLVDELQSLSGILVNLESCVNSNPGLPALQKLGGLSGRLQQCNRDLEALRLKIEIKPDKLQAKIGRLTWPLKEKEVMDYIARLERHKSHFALVLGADHL